MSGKQWLGLLIVTAVLGGLYLYMGRDPGYTGTEALPAAIKALGKFDPDAVSRIEVSKGDFDIEIVRQDDRWIVPATFEYPAREADVMKLVGAVSKIHDPERRAREASSHVRFSIDETSRWEITLHGDGEGLPKTIHVADNRSQQNRSYVKLPDDEVIYSVSPSVLVEGGLSWGKEDPSKWIDLKLATRSSQDPDLVRISMVTPEGETVIERVKSDDASTDAEGAPNASSGAVTWRVIRPEEFTADSAVVSGIVSKSRFIEGVAACDPSKSKDYGIESPTRSIILTFEDGKAIALDVGRQVAEGEDAYDDTTDRFYARLEGDTRIVALPAYTVDGLFRSAEELRKPSESDAGAAAGMPTGPMDTATPKPPGQDR